MYPLAKVVCAPCNAKCWSHCGHACGQCCEAVLTCGGCCCPENRPSPLFLVYTILLSGVPAVIFTAIAFINITHHTCQEFVQGFLLATAALDVFFVLFSIHMYHRFSQPYNAQAPSDKNPFSRACHVFLHDVWVSFFVVAAIGAFIMAIVGFAVFSSTDCGPAGSQGHKLPTVAGVASALLLAYMLGCVIVILISLSVECVRRKPVHAPCNSPNQQAATSQSLLSRLILGRRPPPQLPPPQPYLPPGSGGFPQPAPPAGVMTAPPTQYPPKPSPYVVSPPYLYPARPVYQTASPPYNPPPPQQNASSPQPYAPPPQPYAPQPQPYAPPPHTAVPLPGGKPYSVSGVLAVTPQPGMVVPFNDYRAEPSAPPEDAWGGLGDAPGSGQRAGGAPQPTGLSGGGTSAAEKAKEMGLKIAGGVGAGLKKFGAFVEEKAKGTKGASNPPGQPG